MRDEHVGMLHVYTAPCASIDVLQTVQDVLRSGRTMFVARTPAFPDLQDTPVVVRKRRHIVIAIVFVQFAFFSFIEGLQRGRTDHVQIHVSAENKPLSQRFRR